VTGLRDGGTPVVVEHGFGRSRDGVTHTTFIVGRGETSWEFKTISQSTLSAPLGDLRRLGMRATASGSLTTSRHLAAGEDDTGERCVGSGRKRVEATAK